MIRARIRVTILVVSALLVIQLAGVKASPAAGGLPGDPQIFFTLGYLTWWAHDYKGYHPSILVKLENISGQDLSAEKIQFQARFMDLRTGVLTVARKQIRQPLKPHQQFTVFLKAPYAFDLPMDSNQWPPIECKLMSRVGDVGDEGTQSLVVTRLDNITMTMDSALEQISKSLDYNRAIRAGKQQPPRRQPPVADNKPVSPPQPLQPLKAAAGSLGNSVKSSIPGQIIAFFSAGRKPGLGDDFYTFEKEYGLPRSTETDSPDWTWAKFSKARPELDIFAASRGRTGKVDIIVVQIPGYQISSDSELLTCARSLAGTLSKQKLGEVKKSVTYLPSGRRELSQCKTTDFSAAWVSPRGSGPGKNNYVLILSRATGDPDKLLGSHAAKVKMLLDLKTLFVGD